MSKAILQLNTGEAIAASTDYEAAPGGYIVTLGYKQMAGKPKPPANFVACLPVLDLPATGSPALDAILRSAMEGYAESLVRKLRTTEGEADSIEFDAEDFALPQVIAHAEEKASSLKLSEQAISAWFKTEGEDAVRAHFCAERSMEPDSKTAMQAVATMGVLFAKLAAPTPDITGPVAAKLIERLSLLDQPSSTTQAVRRKLEQRIEMERKARELLQNADSI